MALLLVWGAMASGYGGYGGKFEILNSSDKSRINVFNLTKKRLFNQDLEAALGVMGEVSAVAADLVNSINRFD